MQIPIEVATACIKMLDGELCSDEGMSEYAFEAGRSIFEGDEEIRAILYQADATDNRFYFPTWHPGIENLLRVPCGDRNEFLSDRQAAYRVAIDANDGLPVVWDEESQTWQPDR